METKTQEQFKENLRVWRRDPLRYVREVIKVEPSNQQIEGLKEVQKIVMAKLVVYEYNNLSEKEKAKKKPPTEEQIKYSRKYGISIMSGHGTGKDAFVAWVMQWFLVCFTPTKIPCTAPTESQLTGILRPEFSKWVYNKDKKGEYVNPMREIFKIQTERIYTKYDKSNKKREEDETNFVQFKTAKIDADGQAVGIAGFHEENMMIIVDEASGVPDGVFDTLEGALTDKLNFVIMIFNPVRRSGYAYRSHYGAERELWVPLHWNAEESSRITKEHIERFEKKYGKGTSAYRIRVQGLPPIDEEDILIPWEWVQNAINKPIEYPEDYPIVMGCDVGGGGDYSEICEAQNNKILKFTGFHEKDSTIVGRKYVQYQWDNDIEAMGIDNIGIGNGAYNTARKLGKNVYPVNFSNSARNKEKFPKLRDELYWKLREDFQEGNISIPDDEDLVIQLTSIKYETKDNGKIKIESKKSMKGRGVPSPNKADAIVLTRSLSFIYSRYEHQIIKDVYKDYNSNNNKNNGSWMSA